MSQPQSTILLTGGSSGIGFCAVKEIAKASPGTLVVVASRTPPKEPLPSNVQIQTLDLSSRDSVRSLVASWPHGPLSSLVCNAGIFPGGAPKYTDDGIETSVAINHLNHALLFFLLKDANLLAPTCRIILVTSAMHDPKAPLAPAAPYWVGAKGVADAKDKKLSNPMIRYANSKLEIILFAYALTRRIKKSGKGWTVLAFEPGFVPGRGSKLGQEEAPAAFRWMANYVIPHTLWIFNMFGTVTSTPQVSGKKMAQLVLSDEYQGVNGKYILLHNEKPSSKDSYDTTKQEDVWEWTIDTLAKDAAERARFTSF